MIKKVLITLIMFLCVGWMGVYANFAQPSCWSPAKVNVFISDDLVLVKTGQFAREEPYYGTCHANKVYLFLDRERNQPVGVVEQTECDGFFSEFAYDGVEFNESLRTQKNSCDPCQICCSVNGKKRLWYNYIIYEECKKISPNFQT